MESKQEPKSPKDMEISENQNQENINQEPKSPKDMEISENQNQDNMKDPNSQINTLTSNYGWMIQNLQSVKERYPSTVYVLIHNMNAIPLASTTECEALQEARNKGKGIIFPLREPVSSTLPVISINPKSEILEDLAENFSWYIMNRTELMKDHENEIASWGVVFNNSIHFIGPLKDQHEALNVSRQKYSDQKSPLVVLFGKEEDVIAENILGNFGNSEKGPFLVDVNFQRVIGDDIKDSGSLMKVEFDTGAFGIVIFNYLSLMEQFQNGCFVLQYQLNASGMKTPVLLLDINNVATFGNRFISISGVRLPIDFDLFKMLVKPSMPWLNIPTHSVEECFFRRSVQSLFSVEEFASWVNGANTNPSEELAKQFRLLGISPSLKVTGCNGLIGREYSREVNWSYNKASGKLLIND